MEAHIASFGLVADVQYADKADRSDEGRRQRYRQAVHCLHDAVAAWLARRSKLCCVLSLGDIVDGNITPEATAADLERVSSVFGGLVDAGVRVLHVIGNHCLRAGREALLQQLGMSSSYGSYALSSGWRLILLDTTELSGHSGYPADSDTGREATEFLSSHPLGTNNPQMARWNGGCAASQLKWLAGELHAAEAADDRVIVAAHHQVCHGAARQTHLAWNWKDVQALLLASPAFVLFLAGHDHVGGYAEVDGRHFITVEAMLEAPDGSNAYSFVDLDSNAKTIRIDGVGSVTSRLLNFV